MDTNNMMMEWEFQGVEDSFQILKGGREIYAEINK